MTASLLTGLALARAPLHLDVGLRQDPDWFDKACASGAVIVDVTGAEIDLAVEGVDPEGPENTLGQLGTGVAALRWRQPTPDDAGTAMLLGVTDRPWLAALSPPVRPANLRVVGSDLDDLEASLATTAVALAQWHGAASRCPRCGGQTRVADAGWARQCLTEELMLFPRTEPAVIVLVIDHHDRALLGRRAQWPEQLFSTLAGFVEAGESAERAVLREIAEEAGVRLDPAGLSYRGSQPWPFPASLMLGYHARTLDPQPSSAPDGTEIVETRWFTRDELLEEATQGRVLVPPPVSIARRLIEDWFGAELPGQWPATMVPRPSPPVTGPR